MASLFSNENSAELHGQVNQIKYGRPKNLSVELNLALDNLVLARKIEITITITISTMSLTLYELFADVYIVGQ